MRPDRDVIPKISRQAVDFVHQYHINLRLLAASRQHGLKDRPCGGPGRHARLNELLQDRPGVATGIFASGFELGRNRELALRLLLGRYPSVDDAIHWLEASSG